MEGKPNPWEEAHDKEKVRRLKEREQLRLSALNAKVEEMARVKPYAESNHTTKIFAEWMSYLFNALSAIGGAYAIYWIAQFIVGFVLVSLIAAAMFLFGLEWAKRKASEKLYFGWHFSNKVDRGWLALNIFLCSLSIASTLFGTYKGTFDLAPHAAIITGDSLTNSLAAQLDQNNKIANDLRETKWHGTITQTANRGINEIAETNKTILAAITGRVSAIDGKNEQITQAHLSDVKQAAIIVVCVMLLLEFLFELCIWYVSYYWRRCWEEQKANVKEALGKSNAQPNAKPNATPPPNAVQNPPPNGQPNAFGSGNIMNVHQEPNAEQAEREIKPSPIGFRMPVKMENPPENKAVQDLQAKTEQLEKKLNHLVSVRSENVRANDNRTIQPNAEQNKKANEIRTQPNRTGRANEKKTNAKTNAERLRSNGASYEEIAKELGYSKSTIYKWLNPAKA